jgi:hypothetical protein
MLVCAKERVRTMKKALSCSAVLLGALSSGCGGGGGSAMHSTSGPPPEKKVVVKCDGPNGDIHLGKNRETVIFSLQSGCTKLQPLLFAQPTPGFTFIGTIPDGSTLYYYYDGTTAIPAAGYPFSYPTDLKSGNGTGVIKN